MRRTNRLLALILMMVMLLGAMTFCVGATQMTDSDAMDYLGSYEDNMMGDPDFDQNIAQAIDVAQHSISSYATPLALLPPIIAIALALITKEVYTSLFVGILSGALLYSNCHIWDMVTFTFDTMIGMVSDSWNVGILIFLVLLGMMVSLINKAEIGRAHV